MDSAGKKFIFLLKKLYQLIVSVYGGLRGAVSLSLALVVYNNE